MNYLTLCQRTAREAGISGIGPAKVTDQTGQLALIVNWVNLAWKDLENLPVNWRFDWSSYSVESIESNDTIGMSAQTVKTIDGDTVTAYLKSTGTSDRQSMSFIDYEVFKRDYPRELTRNDDRPVILTRKPNGDLQMYPQPNGIYTIEFDGYDEAQELENNSDIPRMPSDHHEIIIYKALLDYGRHDDAVEIQKHVPGRYAKMLQNLRWAEIVDPHNSDGQMVVRPQ